LEVVQTFYDCYRDGLHGCLRFMTLRDVSSNVRVHKHQIADGGANVSFRHDLAAGPLTCLVDRLDDQERSGRRRAFP
jgi:hypothetical protein